MWQGKLEAIFIAAEASGKMQFCTQARAVPGFGLEGDRYFAKAGTFSAKGGQGRELTLIEAEAIEALKTEMQMELPPGGTRRNLVTRGVPLNHLVGKEFRVGAVRLRGVKLCEPCKHLEELTQPGVMAGLIHRGGLRAEILSEGLLQVGDIIAEI